MPTGYTAAIKDGITFKQYALSCARAFGALIEMRDEPNDAPIPEAFKPSDYHANAIQKAQDSLAKMQSMTDEQCREQMESERKAEIESSKTGIAKTNDLRAKYNAMLSESKAYIPPSSDHEGFKKFMVEQIEESIKFDCSTDYYQKTIDRLPKDIATWKKERLSSVMRDIAYHTKENTEEINRTNSRNLWVKQLRESL